MLPTRLEMRNFLAYRAPAPITLAGIELACLTGQNGVGKSSLLDAITWALWGKARARRDEELIHLGQTEMSVSLDFEHENLRYRVTRRRARAGRGSRATLDLLVWGQNARPRLINEDGVRRTQDKINSILRLDYDTFVHSAFLQQGKADAFTLKTPAERKRLLADMLGLDQWARYERAAKERLAKLSSRSEIISHDIQRLDTEIAGESDLRAEDQRLSKALEAAQAELDAAEKRHKQVAHSAAALRREQISAQDRKRQIAGLRRDIQAAQMEIQRIAGRMQDYQDVLAVGDSIEAGYQQLLAARESQSLIAEHLAKRQDISQRIHQLQQALAAEKAELEREAQVSRERIKALEDSITAASASQIDALREDLRALEALDKRRNEAVKNAQTLRVQGSKTAARLESLIADGRALNERIARLEAADGADCPLCGQALTAEHRDDMLARLTAERDAMRAQYREFTATIQRSERDQQDRLAELSNWAHQLKDLPALQQQLGAATELSRKAQDAGARLQTEATRLEQLEGQLKARDFGQERRRQLSGLEERLAKLAVDPRIHAETKAELANLARYDRQFTELEIARRSLPEAQRSRDEAAARLSKLQASQKAEEKRLKQIQGQIAELTGMAEQEPELRAEVEAIRKRTQDHREQKAICEQQLNAIAAGRESKRRLEGRLAAARGEESLYKDLRLAFGKNGLPAMIIESALPELEAEANNLLARLTEGRMRLRINTQRERASGALTETLELEIADELGARAYELYSGGEAFRINFAVRIALSKLLARRAGAHLRALFIDEGFGSQDEDGRDKLVEAINTIRSEFDFVLVITHIDELRDAFPTHLLVEKGPDGSTVNVGYT